jgi:alkylation response protein AidB-like acyl-CoA dehydrogenase
LNTAVGEIWNAANMALQICPLLTQGAVEALLHHGTDWQKATFVPPMVAGRWTGAMCLTEPQAGSDLGAIRTAATPAHDPALGPHHRLKGQKIYVSWGDHDMAENIVHLVLARLPDAPPGPKGISLFIVPKFLPGADGSLGRRNDWRCLKLEEKLGIHASPTCVIAYGDDEGAVGFMLGPPHRGLACMFTMMNNARLAVGLEGVGLAERAFQSAAAYAAERVQGRRHGRPARLEEHPDIQRLLTGMAAEINAMRALCLTAFAAVDMAERHDDPAVRAAAAGRVALLTPVVKAWCTDRAVAIASDAMQVLGGMGFVEETGVHSSTAMPGSCRSTRAATASRRSTSPAASSRSRTAACPGSSSPSFANGRSSRRWPGAGPGPHGLGAGDPDPAGDAGRGPRDGGRALSRADGPGARRVSSRQGCCRRRRHGRPARCGLAAARPVLRRVACCRRPWPWPRWWNRLPTDRWSVAARSARAAGPRRSSTRAPRPRRGSSRPPRRRASGHRERPWSSRPAG